jgi:hypothetical protein
MKFLAKPTLKRYTLEKEEIENFFPMVSEETKGEVAMKFGSQYARKNRIGVQGITMRMAIYQISKKALEHINSLDESAQSELIEAFINADVPPLKSVSKTHISTEKDWANGEFLDFRNKLEATAKSKGFIQRSSTNKNNTSVFNKEDVFSQLLKYGLSLYK